MTQEIPVSRVIALLPKLDGKGFTEEKWELNKEKLNPNGKKDLIISLDFYNEPAFHVYAEYKDFGVEVILNHLTFIEYARNRSVSAEESGDRED